MNEVSQQSLIPVIRRWKNLFSFCDDCCCISLTNCSGMTVSTVLNILCSSVIFSCVICSVYFYFVFSYLKLYTTMPIAKLAAFLDMVSKSEMILCRSHFSQLVCFYCLHSGSKKGVQDNHNGNERRKRFYTCVITLCTFFCRPLQNNNVKWPILRCLKNVNYDG